MGKYIIELDDKYVSPDNELIVSHKNLFDGDSYSYHVQIAKLTPYTEPDLEQVRKEAYDNGYETAKHECEDCQKIRADAEQELVKKAYDTAYADAEEIYESGKRAMYQKGLKDAWEAARKICLEEDDGGIPASAINDIFNVRNYRYAVKDYSASECIEEIRAYEQAQKEKEEQEQSVTAEEVMRQYLDTFCKHNFCTGCILHTPDFTCGRGYHFFTKNPVSDEEVRRAYVAVLAKEKG